MVKITEIIVEAEEVITKPHTLKRFLNKNGLLSIVRDRSSGPKYDTPWTKTGAWVSNSDAGFMDTIVPIDYDLAMKFANDDKNYLNISDQKTSMYLNIISRNRRPTDEAKNYKSRRRIKHKQKSNKKSAQKNMVKKKNSWLIDPIVKAWPEFYRTRPDESSVPSNKIAKFIRFKLYHYIKSKSIREGFGTGDKLLNNGTWKGHRFSKVLIGGHGGSNFSMIYKWDKGILYLISFVKHQQTDASGAFMKYGIKLINAEESQKAASKLFKL